jgi:hypothetical protein
MDFYSTLERSGLSSHRKTRRELKHILLNERSQAEKASGCIIPTIQHSEKGKIREAVKVLVIGGGLRLGREGWQVAPRHILEQWNYSV